MTYHQWRDQLEQAGYRVQSEMGGKIETGHDLRHVRIYAESGRFLCLAITLESSFGLETYFAPSSNTITADIAMIEAAKKGTRK